MTQQPTFPEFVTEPATTTLGRLEQIPLLVAEALMTADAPNPSGRAERTKRTKNPHPPAPANLGHLVALTPPTDAQIDAYGADGGLMLELLMAVRHLVEEHDGMPDWPAHDWSSIAGWLIDTAPVWQADPYSAGFVDDSVRRCWSGLVALVRLPRDMRMQCTRLGCGERAHLQPGGQWVVCEGGHTLDVDAERGRFLAMQDLTLTEAQTWFRVWLGELVPLDTMKSWVRRGRIEPIRHQRRGAREVALFNFGALASLRRHDLTELQARDSA